MRPCFIVLTISAWFVFSVMAENCSPAYCNYEGECSGPIGNPTCKCLKNYFKGPKCEERYVHCENNPCPTGKECENHFGGYFCKCKEPNLLGDDCDVSIQEGKGVLLNPRIVYSRVTLVNEIVPLLFVMRNKISFNCSIDISWKFGQIASINIVDGEKSPLTYVNDVRDLVKKCNISKAEQIAKTSGVYYKTSIQPPSKGIHGIQLMVRHKGKVLHSMDYEILVLVPHARQYRALPCTPVTKIFDCSTDKGKPKILAIAQWELIKAKTSKSCGTDSSLSYIWTAEDADNAKNKMTFKGKVMNLELEPFQLPGLDAVWKITVTAYEKSKDGSRDGTAGDSCFVQYMNEPPIVVIYGSEIRRVGRSYPFELDVRDSYDPMVKKKGLATLSFVWGCTSNRLIAAKFKYCNATMGFKGPLFKNPGRTLPPGTYTYTVTATATNRKNSEGRATKIVEVVDSTPPKMRLHCIQNCGPAKILSNQVVHMRGACGVLRFETHTETDAGFNWTVSGDGWDAVAEDTETGLNKKKLIIKENVLKVGGTYDITLLCWFYSEPTNTGTATTKIVVNEEPRGGKCDIQPKTGNASYTMFTVTCTDYKDEDEPIQIQIYQLTNGQEMLLKKGWHNSTIETQLCEGSPAKISIHISDALGTYVWSNMSVTVNPLKVENKPANEVMQTLDDVYKSDQLIENNLKELIKNKDFPAALVKVASILSVAPTLKNLTDEEGMKEYKKDFYGQIIGTLEKLPVRDHESAVQMSITSLLVMNSDELEHDHSVKMAKMLENLVKGLTKRRLSDGKTAEEVLTLSKTLLESIDKLVQEQPIESSLNATTTTPAPNNADYPFIEDYPNYFGLDSDAMDRLDDMENQTNIVLNTLSELGTYIGNSLTRGTPPIKIRHKAVFLYVVVEEPKEIVGRLYKDDEAGATGSALFIDENLEDEISSSGKIGTLELQVSILTNNPFWWHPKTPKLDSEVLIVNMHSRSRIKGRGFNRPRPLKDRIFEEPFDIYIKINPTDTSIINGSVTVPKDIEDHDESDLANDYLSIHQFDATKGSSLYIKFTKLSHAIKAIVRLDQRPAITDFEFNEPTVMDNDEAYDESKVIKAGDGSALEGSVYYLAVTPFQEVQARQRMASITVNYSFEVFTAECRYWYPPNADWITDKCQMGPNTNISMMHCRCYHLSTFSGGFFVPPNRIDFQQTYNLLLSINRNLVVLIVLLVIYTIFIALFLWSFAMDKNDAAKKYAIYLENNTPEEEYCYLIMVFTGARPHAGTTAHVVIQIEGDKDITRPRVLSHSKLKMMERSADNWFILTTTKTLGEIHTIKLWHDNSGRHPSWYCKRVYIRDLETERAWTFLPRRWLSLKRGTGEIHCTLHPATNAELTTFTVAFDDLLSYNLQNSHAWLAIGTKHPRTGYLRIQRVTCALCIILSTMLASMMFYGIDQSNPANQADEGEFSIDLRFFVISLESFLITLPSNILLVLLFTRSKPIEPNPDEDKNEEPAIRQLKAKIDRLTVHLHTPYIFPYYGVYIGWALAVVVILVCSIFMILYGLSFGRVRSLLWLSSIMLGLLQSIFLINPLCIIVLAIVIAYITRKGPIMPRATVLIPTKEEKISNEYYRAYCDSLIVSMTLHKPLTEEQIAILRQREKLRQKSTELLKDVLMFILYLCAFYWLLLTIIDPIKYYSNRNIVNLVNGRTYNSGIPFGEVHSDEMFIEYLNNTLLPVLYSDEWYAGANVTGYGWISDYSNKLLGIPRLRQQRVPGSSCIVAPELSNLISNCHVNLLNYMDMKDYNAEWKPFTNSRWRNDTFKVTDPWTFKSATNSHTTTVMGELEFYSGGGHIANLGRTIENSRQILEFLIKSNWIDEQTRVIFVEFSTYDINYNLFNIITLVAERPGIGTYIPSVQVKTERFHILWENVSLSTKIAFVLFVIFSSIFLYVSARGAYRLGPKQYFKVKWNIIDFIIIVLNFICILFFFIRSYVIQILIESLESSKNDEFVSFSIAAYWELMINYVVGLLCCLVTARLWKLLRFYGTFRLMEVTFILAAKTLLSVSVLMFFIIWIFSVVCHLIYGSYMYDYHDIHISIMTLLSMAIDVKKNLGYNTKTNSTDTFFRNVIYLFFICTIRLIMFYLFAYILCFYFQIAKIQHKFYKRETYSIFDYIQIQYNLLRAYYSEKMKQIRKTRKKTKKVEKKIKKRNKVTDKEKTRLRGGGDVKRWMDESKQTAIPKPPAIKYKNSLSCLQYKIDLMKLMVTDYYLSDEEITPSYQMSSMTYVAGYVIRNGDDIFNFFRETKDSSLVTEEQLDIMELYVNYITRRHHHRHHRDPLASTDDEKTLETDKPEYLNTVKLISTELDYAYVLFDYMSLNEHLFDAELFDEVERQISISTTIPPSEMYVPVAEEKTSISSTDNTTRAQPKTCSRNQTKALHEIKHSNIDLQITESVSVEMDIQDYHDIGIGDTMEFNSEQSEEVEMSTVLLSDISPTPSIAERFEALKDDHQRPERSSTNTMYSNLPNAISIVEKSTSTTLETTTSMQTEAHLEIHYNETGVKTREVASIGTDTIEFERETGIKRKVNTRSVLCKYCDNNEHILCKYGHTKYCKHLVRKNNAKKDFNAINKESKAIKKKTRSDISISKLSKLSNYDVFVCRAKTKCGCKRALCIETPIRHSYKGNQQMHHKCKRTENIDKKFSTSEYCTAASPKKHHLKQEYPALLDIEYINKKLSLGDPKASVDKTTSAHFITSTSMQTEAQNVIECIGTDVQTRETSSVGTNVQVKRDHTICKYGHTQHQRQHQARTNNVKKECTAINKESKAIKKKIRSDKSVSTLAKLSNSDIFSCRGKSKCRCIKAQALIEFSTVFPKRDT